MRRASPCASPPSFLLEHETLIACTDSTCRVKSFFGEKEKKDKKGASVLLKLDHEPH